MMDFFEAMEEVKRIEKKRQPVLQFDEGVDITPAFDFAPMEYADFSFEELRALYDRVEKIIKLRSGVEGKVLPPTAKAAAVSKEIEEKVQKISEEEFERIEKIKEAAVTATEKVKEGEKEVIIKEKPAEAPKPSAPVIEFEREEVPQVKEEEVIKRKGAVEIEFEREAPRAPAAIEFEREVPPKSLEKPAEKPPEMPTIGEIPYIEKHEKVVLAVPPILEMMPEEVAAKTYHDAELKVKSVMEGQLARPMEKMSPEDIKKNMLELTKQLFKEKNQEKKNAIKTQIMTLRAMLSQQEEPKPAGSYFDNLLTTIREMQRKELTSAKEELFARHSMMVERVRSQFMESLAQLREGDVKRKKAYEFFAQDLLAINEQMNSIIMRYEQFITKEHTIQLERFKSSLPVDQKNAAKAADDAIAENNSRYSAEFQAIKSMLEKQVENMIEKTGHELFGEVVDETSKAIFEINEMKDEVLLSYLQAKEPKTYLKYMKKIVSKKEVLLRAKALIATERGIPQEVINKYFGVEIEDE